MRWVFTAWAVVTALLAIVMLAITCGCAITGSLSEQWPASRAEVRDVRDQSRNSLEREIERQAGTDRAQWQQISKLIWALTGVGAYGGGYLTAKRKQA